MTTKTTKISETTKISNSIKTSKTSKTSKASIPGRLEDCGGLFIEPLGFG
jgi:hypothetical protein